jgi:hypothetical protein
MLNGMVEEDPRLDEILAGMADSPLALAESTTRHFTTIIFRTHRSAHFASVQLAMRGYPAVVGRRTADVNAPWFLVAALVTRMGIRSEVLGIRWRRSSGRLRSSVRGRG